MVFKMSSNGFSMDIKFKKKRVFNGISIENKNPGRPSPQGKVLFFFFFFFKHLKKIRNLILVSDNVIRSLMIKNFIHIKTWHYSVLKFSYQIFVPQSVSLLYTCSSITGNLAFVFTFSFVILIFIDLWFSPGTPVKLTATI